MFGNKSQVKGSLIKCPHCISKVNPAFLRQHLEKVHYKCSLSDLQIRTILGDEEAEDFLARKITRKYKKKRVKVCENKASKKSKNHWKCPFCSANVSRKGMTRHIASTHGMGVATSYYLTRNEPYQRLDPQSFDVLNHPGTIRVFQGKQNPYQRY